MIWYVGGVALLVFAFAMWVIAVGESGDTNGWPWDWPGAWWK